MDRTRCWRVALILALVALALVPPPPSTQTASASQGGIDDDVVVQITSPQPGQRLRGRVEITGYAVDRRSARGSGLNERDVRLYLDDASNERNLFHYAEGGLDSPVAAAALGPKFENVGFRAAWETCSFPADSYKLIVWVSSAVTPGARNFASVDVEVEPCPEGAILYQDDFASRPGGVYTIRMERPSALYSGIGPVSIFADFAAGIDARCPEPDVECRYWMSFRRVPGPGAGITNGSYAFVVDPGPSPVPPPTSRVRPAVRGGPPCEPDASCQEPPLHRLRARGSSLLHSSSDEKALDGLDGSRDARAPWHQKPPG